LSPFYEWKSRSSRRSAKKAGTGESKRFGYAPLSADLEIVAQRKFWRCVESGEPPALFDVEPPKPRMEAVRMIDMSTSNAWAEFAGTFTRTHPAFLEHERAKADLKSLVPEDAQQAIGHGVHAKRSKSGAISFELLNAEDGHAAV
jgi:hypothetical protein